MKRLAFLVIISLASIFFGVAFGSVSLPLGETFSYVILGAKDAIMTFMGSIFGFSHTLPPAGPDYTIVWDIRLPRVLLAYLVGVSLASAGTASQALFKNPLGDPYILGISGGASVGAALMALYAPRYIEFGALVGALGAVYIVYSVSRVDGHVPVDTLLLAGVAFGFLAGALTSYLLYVKAESVHYAVFWLMGTFSTATWSDVGVVALSTVAGVLALSLTWRELNLLLFGEESVALGLDVGTYRKVVIFLISLLTAVAVSKSGVIGFIGLVSPHAMRTIFGPNHRRLLPASALFGGALTVFADLLARVIAAPSELPVGIVTAMIGAPFFMYLLVKRKRGELYA